MDRETAKYLPWVLGVGAGVAAVALLSRASDAKPVERLPDRRPDPGPTNVDVLRQQVLVLLAQASYDPASVDPDRMDLAANELQRLGLEEEARVVRAKAQEVRIRRTPGPIMTQPGTTQPGTTQPGLPPGVTPPEQSPLGPPPTQGTPSRLPADFDAQYQALIGNPRSTSGQLLAFASTIERAFPNQFGSVILDLKNRAALAPISASAGQPVSPSAGQPAPQVPASVPLTLGQRQAFDSLMRTSVVSPADVAALTAHFTNLITQLAGPTGTDHAGEVGQLRVKLQQIQQGRG